MTASFPTSAFAPDTTTPLILALPKGRILSECGPLLGLCRKIVDLVQTGSTMKANGLVETEVIADVSSRLIVNRTALKTQSEAMGAWIARFRAALEAA